MKYKYITIEAYMPEDGSKRPCYTITNNKSGDELAQLQYYAPWRCYVLCNFDDGVVFNADCIHDIYGFLLNHAGKEAPNAQM